MTEPLRVRRHTDGRVALCRDGMWLTTSIPGVTKYPSWRTDDRDCSGDGWVELFVAELPEPDRGSGWVLPAGDGVLTATADDIALDGLPWPGDIRELRSESLAMLAAVAACERYRAEREATT